jgi:hypothetical protein
MRMNISQARDSQDGEHTIPERAGRLATPSQCFPVPRGILAPNKVQGFALRKTPKRT